MNLEQSPASLLILLLVQLVATCGMVGVIWFVQLITYPQFAEIDEAGFVPYHQHYSNRVTWIVAPLMLLELGTTVATTIFFWRTPEFPLAAVSLLLVVALWALTALVQVPQHTRLSYGYSAETIRELVQGNWWRTILWSLKSVLTALLLYRWAVGELAPK
ncbi:MAG: hypothetical protein AAF733_00755 [Verrucomicrobiota bacterium]